MLCGNMLELNDFVFYETSNEMMANVDVFGALMLHRILGDVDDTEIITIQGHTR